MGTHTNKEFICPVCGMRVGKLNAIGAGSVRIWVCDLCANEMRKRKDPRISLPAKNKRVSLK